MTGRGIIALGGVATVMIFAACGVGIRAVLTADDKTYDIDPNGPDFEYESDIPGYGRVTTFCNHGFRIWLADHEQQGYAMTSQPDPTCQEGSS